MFLYCCCYLMFLCVLVKSRHAQSRAIEVMLNETGMKATDLQYIYIYIYTYIQYTQKNDFCSLFNFIN